MSDIEDDVTPYCNACGGRVDGWLHVGEYACRCSNGNIAIPPPAPTHPYELNHNDRRLLRAFRIEID